ncbi:MAG: nickel-dependent hydrogenase large subunit, partial [Candidatus Omnitrophica bacterium]|nr:nickel-dependent hydrogenase large subunit [Candidatus Omnitrophota bacterium]
ASGLSTPLAQIEYENFFGFFATKPVHYTLAYHWARLIEVLHASERMQELINDPQIADPEVRNIPEDISAQGIGVCEAPRGTLFHHYQADKNALLKKVNLLVATQSNMAAISMSIEKASRSLIREGPINEELLNMVEVAFRAYDPCLACSTHSLEEDEQFTVQVFDSKRKLVKKISRG